MGYRRSNSPIARRARTARSNVRAATLTRFDPVGGTEQPTKQGTRLFERGWDSNEKENAARIQQCDGNPSARSQSKQRVD
jgi:hypothetical protein